MDAAEELIDKILSWVDMQKDCADKLKELATELEEMKKNVNVTKVVGSSVSVGGAAVATAAGVLTLCTGGLAIPFVAATGAVASGLGIVTNVGADIVDAIMSSCTLKEAKKISDTTENLKNEIQKLMESLTDEQQDDDLPPDEYVMERILRAMAKRNGLILKRKVHLMQLVSDLSVKKISGTDIDLEDLKKSVLDLSLLPEFVGQLAISEITRVAMNKAKNRVIRKSVSKAASKMGLRTTAKVIGRVAGGAIDLLFSVPELIDNVHNLGACESEVSKNLKQKAEAMKTASEDMKTEMDKIEELCCRLADMKCIKKYVKRSSHTNKLFLCCSSSKTVQ